MYSTYVAMSPAESYLGATNDCSDGGLPREGGLPCGKIAPAGGLAGGLVPRSRPTRTTSNSFRPRATGIWSPETGSFCLAATLGPAASVKLTCISP